MELRSTQFRKEREATWRRLEALVTKVERRGLHKLAAEDLSRLPSLYRSTVSSLSVARAISLDRNLVAYLENLAQRAFLCVYGTRRSVRQSLRAFFQHDWPVCVRRFRWHLLVSTVFLTLGGVVGYAMTMNDPVQFHTFVDPGLAQDRGPEASTADLKEVLYSGDDTEASDLGHFSSSLFVHNTRVGLLVYALGFIVGVPAIILLLTNGLMLGAFAALYASRGLGFSFWGWILPHGVTEILAIVVCGAGALALGNAVIFPGPTTRLRNLSATGRATAPLLLGAVIMFLAAGLIEGIFRQSVQNDVVRYTVAVLTATIWIVYFTCAGRKASA